MGPYTMELGGSSLGMGPYIIDLNGSSLWMGLYTMELNESGLRMRLYTMELDGSGLEIGPYEIGHGLGMGSYTMELDRTTMYNIYMIFQLQVLTDNSYPPRHVHLVSELTSHPTTGPFPLHTTWIGSNR